MKTDFFTGKHVLISGGSSGIGLSLAQQLFEKGSHVTILARRKDILQEAARKIENYRQTPGQMLFTISADVSEFKQLEKSLSIQRNPVDILINSAGVAYPGEFTKLDIDIFSTVMDINYMGTVNLTKLIVPEMVERNTGHIVNISSLAAVIGIFGYTAYAPSKYAVRGFSRCLRAELKPKGINVSVVLPPDTDTPQLEFEHKLIPDTTLKINQNGGVMSPEKVARIILSGVRKQRFTIIPGFEGKLLYMLSSIFGRYFYYFAVADQSQK